MGAVNNITNSISSALGTSGSGGGVLGGISDALGTSGSGGGLLGGIEQIFSNPVVDMAALAAADYFSGGSASGLFAADAGAAAGTDAALTGTDTAALYGDAGYGSTMGGSTAGSFSGAASGAGLAGGASGLTAGTGAVAPQGAIDSISSQVGGASASGGGSIGLSPDAMGGASNMAVDPATGMPAPATGGMSPAGDYGTNAAGSTGGQFNFMPTVGSVASGIGQGIGVKQGIQGAADLYSIYAGQQLQQNAQQQLSQYDPLKQQQQQSAAQLAQLQAHPEMATSMPGYQAGLTAQQRSLAATGQTNSGAALASLAGYGQNFYNSQIQQLSSLSQPTQAQIGAQNNVLSAGSMAAKANVGAGLNLASMFA